MSSLLCSILTIEIIYQFVRHSIYFSSVSILFTIYQLLLLFSPILKNNKILLIVPIDAYFNLSEAIGDTVRYFFTQNFDIATIGILPGIYPTVAIALMDISGLVILLLRIYSYWQEHKAGKNTKF